VKVSDAANADAYKPEKLASEVITASESRKRVAFIGLGAMGFGMATQLVKSNFSVFGYDVISLYGILTYTALNKC
jgi:NADPH-dependent glutamate synthase beta subunit-like oxidoreductase